VAERAPDWRAKHGWWQSHPFENPANAEAHARTTAVETLDAFADVTLDSRRDCATLRIGRGGCPR
jgi:cysteine synthase